MSVQISEPAADLGVALAIASSLKDKSLDGKTAVIGEIGLSGEVRGVSHAAKRAAEVGRLGFEQMILPKASVDSLKAGSGVKFVGVDRLSDAVSKALA